MIDLLPLKTSVKVLNLEHTLLLKIISADDFIETGVYGSEYCLLLNDDIGNIGEILKLTWGAIIYPHEVLEKENYNPIIFDIKQPEVIASGDVVSVSHNRIDVLYRRGSDSNMLFVTEQCNHQCIMCSQPPKKTDDFWRVSECHKVIDLIDKNEPLLGISGGEPTLLQDNLIDLIEHCKVSLPNTCLHILSNGVAFSDKSYVDKISNIEHPGLLWGIPIYGCTSQQHDFHTQISGSFNNTIHALYNLKTFNQNIELRVVLTRMVLDNIKLILEFILWNLPFVNSVALMGVEPIGYARKNHAVVWAELDPHINEIISSVNHLRNSSINIFLYNIPLCKLPEELHDIAIRSISDWKNVYEPNCYKCKKINQCCGFFKSHNVNFVRKGVSPFQ